MSQVFHVDVDNPTNRIFNDLNTSNKIYPDVHLFLTPKEYPTYIDRDLYMRYSRFFNQIYKYVMIYLCL